MTPFWRKQSSIQARLAPQYQTLLCPLTTDVVRRRFFSEIPELFWATARNKGSTIISCAIRAAAFSPAMSDSSTFGQSTTSDSYRLKGVASKESITLFLNAMQFDSLDATPLSPCASFPNRARKPCRDAQNRGTKAVYHLTFRGPCSRHSMHSISHPASRVTFGGSRHWPGVTSGKLSSPSPQVRLAPAIPMLYA